MSILSSIFSHIMTGRNKTEPDENKVDHSSVIKNQKPEEEGTIASLVESVKESNALLTSQLDIQHKQLKILEAILHAIGGQNNSNFLFDLFRGSRIRGGERVKAPEEKFKYDEKLKRWRDAKSGRIIKNSVAEAEGLVKPTESILGDTGKIIAKQAGKVTKGALNFAGKAMGPLTAGLEAYDEYQQSNDIGRAASAGGGAWAGMETGAWAGALAGAAIPVLGEIGVGEVAGGIVGGIGGAFAGSNVGKTAYDWLFKSKGKSQAEKINDEKKTEIENAELIDADLITFNANELLSFKANEIEIDAKEIKFENDDKNGAFIGNDDSEAPHTKILTKDDEEPHEPGVLPKSAAPAFSPTTSTGNAPDIVPHVEIPTSEGQTKSVPFSPLTSTNLPPSQGTTPWSVVPFREVPAYAKGTPKGGAPKSGPAVVGEKGTEAIVNRHGGVRFTESGSHIENLEKGDIVIPHDKLKKHHKKHHNYHKNKIPKYTRDASQNERAVTFNYTRDASQNERTALLNYTRDSSQSEKMSALNYTRDATQNERATSIKETFNPLTSTNVNAVKESLPEISKMNVLTSTMPGSDKIAEPQKPQYNPLTGTYSSPTPIVSAPSASVVDTRGSDRSVPQGPVPQILMDEKSQAEDPWSIGLQYTKPEPHQQQSNEPSYVQKMFNWFKGSSGAVPQPSTQTKIPPPLPKPQASVNAPNQYNVAVIQPPQKSKKTGEGKGLQHDNVELFLATKTSAYPAHMA